MALVDFVETFKQEVEANIAASHRHMEKALSYDEYLQTVGGIRVMRQVVAKFDDALRAYHKEE